MRRAVIHVRPGGGCPPCRAALERVAPRLRAAGVDVSVVEGGAVVYPTIVARDGAGNRIRCRGYPPEEAVAAMCAESYSND